MAGALSCVASGAALGGHRPACDVGVSHSGEVQQNQLRFLFVAVPDDLLLG